MVKAMDEFYVERSWEPLFPTFQRRLRKSRDIAELKAQIVAQLRVQPFTILDVKLTFMSGDSPFLITRGDFRKAVLELLREKAVERLDGKKTPPSDQTPFRVRD